MGPQTCLTLSNPPEHLLQDIVGGAVVVQSAYPGALHSSLSPSRCRHEALTPQTCWVQVVFAGNAWCPPMYQDATGQFTADRSDHGMCEGAWTIPTQSSLLLCQLTTRHVQHLFLWLQRWVKPAFLFMLHNFNMFLMFKNLWKTCFYWKCIHVALE